MVGLCLRPGSTFQRCMHRHWASGTQLRINVEPWEHLVQNYTRREVTEMLHNFVDGISMAAQMALERTEVSGLG